MRACARTPRWADGISERLRASVENLLAPEYILNGLDLKSGTARERLPVPETPQRADYREPRFPFAEAFVAYRSPWVIGRLALAAVGPDDRADFVDAAARAIASSHFRQELAALEIESDPAAHFDAMESLLLDPTSLWPRRFAALSDQARDAVRTTNEPLADARMSALIEALGSNRRVQYIDGSTKQEHTAERSRRLQHAALPRSDRHHAGARGRSRPSSLLPTRHSPRPAVEPGKARTADRAC